MTSKAQKLHRDGGRGSAIASDAPHRMKVGNALDFMWCSNSRCRAAIRRSGGKSCRKALCQTETSYQFSRGAVQPRFYAPETAGCKSLLSTRRS